MTFPQTSTNWLIVVLKPAILNHMVDQVGNLDGVFHALANNARREILHRLADQPLTVGELAAPLAMSLAATSKHIKVLERAGLVEQTIAGRQHLCHLAALPLVPALDWLRTYEHFWEERLDALERHFRASPAAASPRADAPVLATPPTLEKEEDI
jgi:DNA-binding transcriptional ArsR family regulator